MGREERLACYRSGLARIASKEVSYVIFEDAQVEGRVAPKVDIDGGAGV